MKRTSLSILTVILWFAACVGVYAALTNSSSVILTRVHDIQSQSPDLNPIYMWANEVEDMLEGTTAIPSLQLTSPIITTPSVTFVTEVSAANDVLTASQSGSYLFYTAGQDITLPAATGSGVVFFIVDANVTAASDLTVYPATGD